ncbi:transmembrane inner ear expressed protein [Anthonomus grandis grandis]|uniref:transmembrane inner ear expressed protein n=1 Tax=Anthonomus grandis grandis TaxID=2921223 RepID=UPI0021654A72|nr:transmembrane inner ear expressed protein [Anthonomus grandis grandis]
MSLATFEANPDSENEPWIERPAIEGAEFRIWHLMFFALCAFGMFVILICCCIRIRVPRTKQEIEADFKRKKIATKFRKRLKIISNQDMESVDLRKALEIIIEADYKEELKQQEEDTRALIQTEENTATKINFGDKIVQIGRMAGNVE